MSEGCRFCYADTLSKRNPKVLGTWGPQGTRVVASEAMWKEPLKWNREHAENQQELWENHGPTLRRHRVFCASLSDVFEDWEGPIVNHIGVQVWKLDDGSWTTSDHYRDTVALTMNDVRQRLFQLIDATPNLDWLLLTKRPENIQRMWPKVGFPDAGIPGTLGRHLRLDNVLLGTSVENQEYADKRIPELLKCQGLTPVLFLSAEPLLGPIDLRQCGTHEGHRDVWFVGNEGGREYSGSKRNFINWVIAGAESGSKRRPANIDWFRSLRDQCKNAGVPFFMKQLEVDGKITDNMADFPEDLRIQEYPDGSR